MKRIFFFIVLALLCLNGGSSIAKTSLNVTFLHDGLTLYARLQLPAGSGPYRVIIINPGSGANDRDGTIPLLGANATCLYAGLYGDTLTPYKGLSEAFSDSGYAVLTYDKVEYTYSNPGTITFHKLWLPVESAIRYLKTRNDIDTTNIILLGHSEGSGIVPYIARTHPEVKALISLAGPRTPLDSILGYQLRYIAHTCGQDTNQANTQAFQVLQYFAAVRSGNWNAVTPAAFGVTAAVWSDYLKVIDSVSINYNLAHRSTLFVGLGSDINVPIPTELNRFQQEITVPADFYKVPGLIHYLTTTTNPATSEMLTDTIIYWLRQRVPPLSVQNVHSSAAHTCIVTTQQKVITVRTNDHLMKQVTIYDMQGREIWKQHAADEVFSFSADDCPAGVYMLRVAENGTESVHKILLQ